MAEKPNTTPSTPTSGKPSKFAEQNKHTAERKADEASHAEPIKEPPVDPKQK